MRYPRPRFSTPSWDKPLHGVIDSETTAVSTATRIGHNTTGTAGVGFGTAIDVEMESSTTQDTLAGRIVTTWIVAAHATRRSSLALFAYGQTTAVEGFRITASLTGTPMIGFYGHAVVAQHTSTGETTGFTGGAGTAVRVDATFTGNVGATAYTIGDIVKAMKNCGLMAE